MQIASIDAQKLIALATSKNKNPPESIRIWNHTYIYTYFLHTNIINAAESLDL